MIAQALALPATKPVAKLTIPPGNKYGDIWNGLSTADHKKLMVEAGYNSNHWNQRAWTGIPFGIREDLIAVMKRYQRASTPKPAAPAKELAAPKRKKYWWEKEGGADE